MDSTSTTIEAIRDTARDALRYFTTADREPEAPASAVIVKTDDAPDWLAEAIRGAHDLYDLMPDDLTYQMARDAIAAIADDATDDDDDDAHEYADSAPSVYTGDLLAYPGNAAHRAELTNESVTAYGETTVEGAAAVAWYYEAREVYDIMRAAITEQVAA